MGHVPSTALMIRHVIKNTTQSQRFESQKRLQMTVPCGSARCHTWTKRISRGLTVIQVSGSCLSIPVHLPGGPWSLWALYPPIMPKNLMKKWAWGRLMWAGGCSRRVKWFCGRQTFSFTDGEMVLMDSAGERENLHKVKANLSFPSSASQAQIIVALRWRWIKYPSGTLKIVFHHTRYLRLIGHLTNQGSFLRIGQRFQVTIQANASGETLIASYPGFSRIHSRSVCV